MNINKPNHYINISITYLDHPSVNIQVIIDLVQRRNGHNLGDGAESKHFCAPQIGEVCKAVGSQLERVRDKFVEESSGLGLDYKIGLVHEVTKALVVEAA